MESLAKYGLHGSSSSLQDSSSEMTVCILQLEAFDHDQAIRDSLAKQKYVIRKQQLVTLSSHDAHYFVQEICDPASEFHRVRQERLEQLQRAKELAAAQAQDAMHGERAGRHTSSDALEGSDNNAAEQTPTDPVNVLLPPLVATTAKQAPSGSATASPRAIVSARSAAGAGSANNSPRIEVNSSEKETERLSDAVEALSRSPIVVLVLEKENAVKDLIELIGPSNPMCWTLPAHSNCLRAKFGIDARRLALRCSKQPETVVEEIRFLLDNHFSSTVSGASGAGGAMESARLRHKMKSTKSVDVDMDQLMNFLFPPHLQHPNSVGRLFVFALYGPLDHKSRLRSGEKGLHVVTDQELTTMCNRIERDDILAVYRLANLAQDEEEEVLRHVESRLKVVPRYTKRDVYKLFEVLRRDHQGKMSFHEMQQVILKERVRRVMCMKEAIDPCLALPLLNKHSKALTRLSKTSYEIAPPSMFLKDVGMDDCDNSVLVSRLLSRFSFEICHLDDGNSPELTQNVRLTRQDILLPRCANILPWNVSTRVRK